MVNSLVSPRGVPPEGGGLCSDNLHNAKTVIFHVFYNMFCCGKINRGTRLGTEWNLLGVDPRVIRMDNMFAVDANVVVVVGACTCQSWEAGRGTW